MSDIIIDDGVYIITRRYMCRPFNELSDEDKRRVMDKYWTWNIEDIDWWDAVYDNFIDEMEGHGIHIDAKDIHFRGFSSQGDGAAFAGSVSYPEEFLRDNVPPIYRAAADVLLMAMKAELIELEFTIKNIGTHYPTQFGWLEISWFSSDITLEEESRLQDAARDIADWLQEFCRDMSYKLFHMLMKEYDYLTSEECLAESFNANDCLFEIGTGKLFYKE